MKEHRIRDDDRDQERDELEQRGKVLPKVALPQKVGQLGTEKFHAPPPAAVYLCRAPRAGGASISGRAMGRLTR
jgi:hypothetical protein